MFLGFLVVRIVEDVEKDIGDFEFVKRRIMVDFELEFLEGILDPFFPVIHLMLIEYFKRN